MNSLKNKIVMKIDTQGMSLDLPPEKDPKTGLWLEPKPIENQRKELPKAIITPKRLFTESYVKEMKILINEVLDEREGKFNYHSYFDTEKFQHNIDEPEPEYKPSLKDNSNQKYVPAYYQ